MAVLDNLQADGVFYYFEEITKIPHGSGNEAALGQYIVDFAKRKKFGIYHRQSWKCGYQKRSIGRL